MTRNYCKACWWGASIGLVVPLLGCATTKVAPAPSSATAWQRREQTALPPPIMYRERSLAAERAGLVAGVSESLLIASVDGRPIARRRFLDLLYQSHGSPVLEQLVGLEVVIRAAELRGLSINEADVLAELDRALKQLVDPLAGITPGSFDRPAAQRLLDVVLAERNLSREAFGIVMRRNAVLRKMLVPTGAFAGEALQREYERLYGPRVRVRHIQLPTLGAVERARERLTSGEVFDEVAASLSANVASAEVGGLLDPFTAWDEAVPALFRKAAFDLSLEQVSGAIKLGGWYHLIRLEERLPASSGGLNDVRAEVERSLRHRQSEQAMFTLFEKLMKKATIEVHDPVLKAAYEKWRKKNSR